MTGRGALAALALLLVGQLSPAGQGPPPPAECTPAKGQTHVARVRWQGPEGAVPAAMAVAVSYPTASLVVPGTGTALPPDTRVEGPPGAMLAVTDADGELRIVVANPNGVTGDLVARVRLRRCEGAGVPARDALGCRVIEASDEATNPLGGLACGAVLE